VTLRLGAIFDSLADEFEATLFADPDVLIDKLAPLESAGPADLSFLSHPKYLNKLAASSAACVIVSPAMEDAAVARGGCIVVADPYRYFARVTQVWKQHHEPQEAARIHPSASIDPSAQLGVGVSVAAFVCIGAGAVI
jgi:UDP-3-O-[3-hydroxymyristoyl] glucosamine N-acyltransferase